MFENKIHIKGDHAVEILRGAIGHRATWTGLTYTQAKEAGKAEEAEKFIREAIEETARIQGAALKAKCPNPESVQSFTETFLHPTLKTAFEIEYINKTDDRVDLEFHHCPLLKAWQELGFDDETCIKLCDMAMDGDRGLAKAMGYEHYLGDTKVSGCPTCKMSYFKTGK